MMLITKFWWKGYILPDSTLLHCTWSELWLNWSMYSRMDQVKFFKVCLPQTLPGPFLNTWPKYCSIKTRRSLISMLFYISNAWKVFKYGVISGPYFPVFRLNRGKYRPEITPYVDTFHAVKDTGYSFTNRI